MTILITGCAGFIGAHLAKKLLGNNHHITGVDNLNDYYSVELKKARLKYLVGKNKNFVFQKADIGDKKKLDEIFSKNSFDLVIHLAAQAGVRYSLVNPYVYEKTNIEGTLNILEAVRHSQPKPKLIFASSSSVYGNSKQIPFKENDPCNKPASFYGATKKAGEMMVRAYYRLYGIKSCCLRFFTAYGPWGRPDMAYYSFTKKISSGEPIDLFQNNTQRDFTYIDDIVEAIDRLVQKEFDFEIINLGNSRPERLDKFVGILEKCIGKKAKVKIKELPPGDIKATYADISKTKKLLFWHPKINIEEGLKNFVNWYKTFSLLSFRTG